MVSMSGLCGIVREGGSLYVPCLVPGGWFYSVVVTRRGGEGVLNRRDVFDPMHGRSRMTIDPRILTMPERSMSGFHRLGRH